MADATPEHLMDRDKLIGSTPAQREHLISMLRRFGQDELAAIVAEDSPPEVRERKVWEYSRKMYLTKDRPQHHPFPAVGWSWAKRLEERKQAKRPLQNPTSSEEHNSREQVLRWREIVFDDLREGVKLLDHFKYQDAPLLEVVQELVRGYRQQMEAERIPDLPRLGEALAQFQLLINENTRDEEPPPPDTIV